MAFEKLEPTEILTREKREMRTALALSDMTGKPYDLLPARFQPVNGKRMTVDPVVYCAAK